VPKDFPGSPEVYELPAWGTGSFTDGTLDINAKNPKQAYCSEDNVCWEGHWQTLHAGVNNGFDPCSLTAAEVEQLYPTYWNDIIEEKTAKVQIELGSNTMTIIMTTVTVITLGSLMRLSLVKRFDEPQAWLRRFYVPLCIFVFLPLFNFYDFLLLASRIVRILWHYCDEFITTECMVTKTPGYENMSNLLMYICIGVFCLHMTLPAAVDKAAPVAVASSDVYAQLEGLVVLFKDGHLTEEEYDLAKAKVLGAPSSPKSPTKSPSKNNPLGDNYMAVQSSQFE